MMNDESRDAVTARSDGVAFVVVVTSYVVIVSFTIRLQPTAARNHCSRKSIHIHA